MKVLSFILSLFYMLTAVLQFPLILIENAVVKNNDLETQQARIEELKEYYKSDSFVPVDESKFCDFDFSSADNLKLNEIACIATHNSYQTTCSPLFSLFQKALDGISFGKYNSKVSKFCSDTLTEQFNIGIRSIELDIETVVKGNDISFACVHNPSLSTNSTCRDFALALQEIKMWMDYNPGHMPITVIIEPKDFFLVEKNMKFLTVEYANAFDKLLRDTFGDKLLTPADVMGDNATLKIMRENDAWPTLKEARGHIIFTLHPCKIYSDYIAQDSSMKTQAMFPLTQVFEKDKDYSAFMVINNSANAKLSSEEIMKNGKFIVRTRSDNSFGIFSDETAKLALGSFAQIISTDYPPKAHEELDHKVTFNNGATIRLAF